MDNQEQAPTLNESIQEVQGIFPSDAALQDAVGRLTRAGFDRAAISLPAANPPAAEATPSAGAENPVTEDDTRQARTLGSSMAATAGAMVGAGVVVATGGAAVAAVAAAAGLGLVAGGAAHTAAPTVQDDARDAAAAAGELVLSATAHDPDAVLKATAAMQAAGATRVATVSRTGGALD
jgi:isopropylmalate/homocitrate/citramalate synthase